VAAGCSAQDGSRTERVSAPAADAQAASITYLVRLSVRETRFFKGAVPFEWRGLTAFALLQQIARGRESDAAALLDWAARNDVTVVRVLSMARHLFELSPEQGRAALPRLLTMAADRGLYVEVVALADTADVTVDIEGHVRGLAAIVAGHSNAIVEIANEPGHPTQRADVHEAPRLAALAALVPDTVPVALGSAEYGDAFAAGDYVTFHFPRDADRGGWGHVLRLADGAGLLSLWRKPLVSDEPIGAGPQFVPGRRDNHPARFGAAGALTRFAGMYPTFHYEGGLTARIPSGAELEAFGAWRQGVRLAERVPLSQTIFAASEPVQAVARTNGARSTFARQGEQEAWIMMVDPGSAASIEWSTGWRAEQTWDAPGVRLVLARRQ
jgi:hypothetical protein